MKVENDYTKAVEIVFGLFTVQLSDGGWSIADGAGTILTPKDEIELSGYHLPVRFESEGEAVNAIKSGPQGLMFDINVNSVWSKHALSCGGIFNSEYTI